jgi:hypothetical protein
MVAFALASPLTACPITGLQPQFSLLAYNDLLWTVHTICRDFFERLFVDMKQNFGALNGELFKKLL